MIRQVEELCAELDSLRFGDFEIFARGKIDLRQPWTSDAIPSNHSDESHLVSQIRAWHSCTHTQTRIVISRTWGIPNAVHAGTADRRYELINVKPRVGVSGHRILISAGYEICRIRLPSHRVGLRGVVVGDGKWRP